MELTDEQKRENIECLKAFWRGEREFECQLETNGPWTPCQIGIVATRALRRKPNPAAVPWDCKEDVPLNCWLRWKPEHDCSKEMLIHMISDDGIFVATDDVTGWRDLGEFEYSTDRKTWRACTKP